MNCCTAEDGFCDVGIAITDGHQRIFISLLLTLSIALLRIFLPIFLQG